MTETLEEAVDVVRTLPENDQERVAAALFAFVRERGDYGEEA